MLNTTNLKIGGNTANVSFSSASTGIIQKSHPKSRFIRCHKASKMADWVFDDEPCLKKKDKWDRWEPYINLTVLQIMVFGTDELLIEIVYNNFLIEEKS